MLNDFLDTLLLHSLTQNVREMSNSGVNEQAVKRLQRLIINMKTNKCKDKTDDRQWQKNDQLPV